MNSSRPLSATTALHQKFQQALELHQLGQLREAQTLYEGVLKKQPKHFDALHMLGVVCYQTGQLERAATLIGKAIALVPDVAIAHNNMGNVLQDQRRLDQALVSYNKAIALNPGFAEAHNNRGDLLQVLGRLEAALVSYEKAILLDPNNAVAHYNRGNAFKMMGRYDEALKSYDAALVISPDYADVLHNRGHVFAEQKKYAKAIQSYDLALKIQPDIPYLAGTRLNLKMHMCDWRNFDQELAQLLERVKLNKKVSAPFPFLALSDDAALQRQVAQITVSDKYSRKVSTSTIRQHRRHDKIRLGYFSADLFSHPVSHLIAGLFESHDQTRFETHAFSLGPDTKDSMRQRLEQAFNHFHDVQTKSNHELVALVRKHEIDIAIDLSGLTKGGRPEIFAARVAPVQINYLGYPGTMGAEFMDYLIADPTLIPEESQHFYSEKIIYLPHSYQANDRKRQISERVYSRKELGLPEAGFVFCCFNSNYKILPETFDSWMRILKAVPDSVLWLFQGSEETQINLQAEALKRDVQPERLVFALNMPMAEHLSRQRAADLFLDTLPYNAHTTASDALWAGLPVLTCTGESFASRVAASLLNAIGLPELISTSQQDFEGLAIALANQPERLQMLRRKLSDQRVVTPLFDTERFAQHIEQAFELVHARRLSGQPAEHLRIAP